MNINKYKYKRNSYATRGIWNLSSDYSVLNLCNRHFSNTIIINQPESPDEQIDRHLREVGEATPAAPTPNVSTSEVLTPGASDRAPNLPIPSSVNEEEGQQEASEQETAVERQIRLNREAAAAAEVARQAALAPRIEDPLLPSLHEFNVVKQNESLVEDAKTMFEHQHKYSNRYVIPDNELSHFKDKQNASELKSIKEAYIYYSTRFNLSNKIVQAIFSSCRSLSPISESYLKELHQIFISKDDNRELPVVCLAPSRPGSLSKVLYGLATGAHDLHHFDGSGFDVMDFTMEWEPANVAGTHITVKFSQAVGAEKLQYKVSSFAELVCDPVKLENIDVRDPNRSMFTSSGYTETLSEMYDISGAFTPEYNYTTESSRTALVNRNSDGLNFLEGFKIPSVMTNDLKVDGNAVYIAERLTPMFMMPKLFDNGADVDDLLSYVGSLMCAYAKTRITHAQGVFLRKLSMDITLTKKKDGQLEFKKYVDKGKIVPISPLHYSFYFNSMPDDIWSEIIFYSAFADYQVSRGLFSLTPMCNSVDKFEFANYAQERERLTSSYYHSGMILPFQKDRLFNIDFDVFVKEMYARIMVSGNMPDYMVMISASQWAFGNIKSIPVNGPVLHPIVCRFGLSNDNLHMKSYCRKLCMMTSDFKPEYYERSQMRMVKDILDIYGRFLPNA